MANEPTVVGRVRHVLGSTITVELDPELAGIAPLWEGYLQPVGQVGSLVRIPQGPISLLATVTMVGIVELTSPLTPANIAQLGDRWLQAQLLGEIDGLGRFRRGVSTYPALDDPVHFTTAGQLKAVYPPPAEDRVKLGVLAAAPTIPCSVSPDRLVMRHSAIVGSTGAGKTSAVAALVQHLVSGGWRASNIIIIDPHGEYASAFSGFAAERSVRGTGSAVLNVPYWALPSGDILRALCGSVESNIINTKFNELVAQARREFVRSASWIKIDESEITGDTPVPFDIRTVWYNLDIANRATYSAKHGGGTQKMTLAGDPSQLRPAQFEAPAPGDTPPYRGPTYDYYANVPERLRLRLADPRLGFFVGSSTLDRANDPLLNVINDWLGDDKPVSVLDFSGVAAEISDLAIGVVLQLLFEVAVRSESTGIGRPRPVLIVLEEAHRYLSSSVATVRAARESANRIAREGRKYGIGLLLVTQRPSELPDTALAQVGTIIALRLTNDGDQATVKAALPDSVAGLADALPSLRTGEAIVSGEALELPTRVILDIPNPRPRSDDPTLAPWRAQPTANDLTDALKRWRGL